MAEAVKVSEEMIRSVLKPRSPDSRKGDNGVVAVVGGGRLYHGAPFLSASAALRSGVDLAYLCVPQSIATAVRALSPNVIVIPRPDVKLTVGAVNKLLKWLPEVDAVVVGPGLGRQRTDGACKLVRELASDGVKVVLDADGLRSDIVEAVKGGEAVITPHAGEFRRLFNTDIESSVESRVEKVREMSEKSGVTILLKGRVDVISDGGRAALNHTGSPAMTAGGTGDVLSGVVAGLLAKGLEPFYAASSAAYFNGLAGEKAAERRGMHIVASDLIDELPGVMRKFD
ncbi:MAG: NAD(P)H-hydrate dehydratase [Nitrososphaerales archaeon]